MKWIRISSLLLNECRGLVSSSWIPVWRWPNLIRQQIDRFLVGLLLVSFTISTVASIAIEVAISWKDQTHTYTHTHKKKTERKWVISASALWQITGPEKKGGIIKCHKVLTIIYVHLLILTRPYRLERLFKKKKKKVFEKTDDSKNDRLPETIMANIAVTWIT